MPDKKAKSDIKSGQPADKYKSVLPDAPKKTVEQIDKVNSPSSRSKPPGSTRI